MVAEGAERRRRLLRVAEIPGGQSRGDDANLADLAGLCNDPVAVQEEDLRIGKRAADGQGIVRGKRPVDFIIAAGPGQLRLAVEIDEFHPRQRVLPDQKMLHREDLTDEKDGPQVVWQDIRKGIQL